jgi:hypothetical protein
MARPNSDPLDYSDLEVDQRGRAYEGLEVRRASGLELDHRGALEFDPNAPPQPATQFSTDAKVADVRLESLEAQRHDGRFSGRRTRILLVAAILLLAAAIGGGLGGGLAARNRALTQTPTSTSAPPPSHFDFSPVYGNSSLAATEWQEQVTNVTHYRVYFQAKTGTIWESAWDSNSSTWTVSPITDSGADIKMGTPLTAVNGYPHINSSWAVVSLSTHNLAT